MAGRERELVTASSPNLRKSKAPTVHESERFPVNDIPIPGQQYGIITTTHTVLATTVTTEFGPVGQEQDGAQKEEVEKKRISKGMDSLHPITQPFKTPASQSMETASLDQPFLESHCSIHPGPVKTSEEVPTRTAVVLDKPFPLCSGSYTDLPPELNLPANLVSDQTQPTPASSDQTQPTPAASDQMQPTPASLDQRQPTPASSDQRQPTPASSDQRQPTPASSDQTQPTPASSDQTQPTPADPTGVPGPNPQSTQVRSSGLFAPQPPSPPPADQQEDAAQGAGSTESQRTPRETSGKSAAQNKTSSASSSPTASPETQMCFPTQYHTLMYTEFEAVTTNNNVTQHVRAKTFEARKRCQSCDSEPSASPQDPEQAAEEELAEFKQRAPNDNPISEVDIRLILCAFFLFLFYMYIQYCIYN